MNTQPEIPDGGREEFSLYFDVALPGETELRPLRIVPPGGSREAAERERIRLTDCADGVRRENHRIEVRTIGPWRAAE